MESKRANKWSNRRNNQSIKSNCHIGIDGQGRKVREGQNRNHGDVGGRLPVVSVDGGKNLVEEGEGKW